MWYQKYLLTLSPIPVDLDATEQRLTVLVDDADTNQGGTFGPGEEVVPLMVPRDSEVTLQLGYADAAGNVSDNPLVFVFTATDQVAPQSPESIGTLAVDGEEWVPDVEPTPEPPVED